MEHYDALHKLLQHFDFEDTGMQPVSMLEKLVTDHLDDLPLPGQGNTLARWQRLALVASYDLSLAKLFEGHTDALAILAELNAPIARAGSLWAVWGADPAEARVTATRALPGARLEHLCDIRLNGVKAWCSGAQGLTNALLTVRDNTGALYLAAVDLPQAGMTLNTTCWKAVGMRGTSSADIEFSNVPGRIIGRAGAYLDRPGFWYGGAGVAACWYGAAAALGHCMRGGLSRSSDPHFMAHLGAVDVALQGARATLHEVARSLDATPGKCALAMALQARLQVEKAATEVITHAGRALGARPFCRDARFARMMADLPVFIRQSHAERDLAFLGSRVLEGAALPWAL